MIAKGATTLWEIWEDKVGPSMNSHNHPMLGSVGSWFYRALGGINMQPGTEGYQHILIKPNVVEDLHWASASIETVRGLVSCSWKHTPGAITMDVWIPVNSDAKVVVPMEDDMTEVTVREGDHVVWSDGHFAAGDAGVTGATAGSQAVTFEVGSGRYQFTLTGE